MECPRCRKKIQAERVLPLSVVCPCGWSDEHVSQHATVAFQSRIKNTFVVMTAILSLTLSYRFATERLQARADRHTAEIAKAARTAASQRRALALRAQARQHEAMQPNHGYVRAAVPSLPPASERAPAQFDSRLAKARPSRS